MRLIEKQKTKFMLIFFWLAFLVFFAYRKSLGLNLYGDDWLVISKFYGGYGPGKPYGYFDLDVWISNYGFQNLIALIYPIFKFYSLPYFLISLFFRILLAYGIFLFVKRFFSEKAALFSSSLFAVSVVGAETTDFVYNFNSYIGIFLSILGLEFYISSEKLPQKIRGWLLIILGYIIAPIRLFISPFAMIVLKFLRELTTSRNYTIYRLPTVFLVSASALLPFLALRFFFPFLGWQSNLSFIINKGISAAGSMLAAGRFDFLLTPFTTLGRMLIPYGLSSLAQSGWSIYPVGKFLIYGGVLGIVGAILLFASFKKFILSSFINSLFISGSLLVGLKFFVRYQGHWFLKEFPYFTWTYFGMILLFIFLNYAWRAFSEKKEGQLLIIVTGLIFLFSFLFPWMYNPGYLFDPQHRYMILSSVGLSFLLGIFLAPIFKTFSMKRFVFYFTLALFFALVQMSALNRYLDLQLTGRTPQLDKFLFAEIKSSIQALPEDEVSVFYFENFHPAVYESLLRASFGYHIQLLYNSKFNEQTLPFSVSTFEDLVTAISDPGFSQRLGYNNMPTIDNVFAFKMEEGRLIDITSGIREKLSNTSENK